MTIDTQLSDLLDEWFDIADRIDQLDARKKQIANEFLTLGVGRHDIPGVGTITVSEGAKRFNPDRATEVLTPDLIAACSETKLSATRAKEVLAPAVYQMCTIAGTPRLTVKGAA